jgi:ADP-ribose pyrophosphatase YjhB (NUDIX family)
MDPRQVFSRYDHHSSTERAAAMKFCPRCGSAMELMEYEEHLRPRCTSCGFVLFMNPFPTVALLIVEDGRFLLARRSKTSMRPGLWCLPGGFVEWEEDFLTAGRREALEETGLVIEVESILSVVSSFLGPNIHPLNVTLLAHPVGGEAVGGDDIDLVEWFRPGDELPELAFEADGHIIQRYFEAPYMGAPIDPRYSGAQATASELPASGGSA